MTTKDISGVVNWLKGWFYDKGDVNGLLNAKLNNNLTNANMNVVTDSSGNVITEAKPTPYSHPSTHGTDIIKEANALSNIGTSANATQQTINGKINEAIGQLKGIEFIKVVSDKGTASADTMNKLYIVSENNKVNVYYTKATTSGGNTTYDWEKMDADILDELTVSWNDLTDKPSTFTPSAHAVNASTYGLGTTGVYGHVKTVNGLTTSSHSNGLALSAYQGYVLNNAKADKTNAVKDIELVPKSTDNTGAIKLIFADE